MAMQAQLESGRIAWHVITSELHTGMLTLAFASVILTLLSNWIKSSNLIWQGLIRLAEPTAYLAATGGLLSLVASVVTGFTYTWPAEVLLTSSVVLNKIAISAFSVTFWIVFVLMRSLYGARLWEQARLKGLYVMLAAGGFLTLMLAGSTGGHLAGKRSLLDTALHHLGIKTHLLLVLSQSVIFALLAFTAGVLILTLVLRWATSRRQLETHSSRETS